MKHLISWYILPYITAILIATVAWIVAIYTADGFVPIVCGLILLCIAVFTIPVMIYMDYRTIKDLVLFGADAYKEPAKRGMFYEDITVRVGNQLGVPEVIAKYVIKRVIKKFNL